MMVSHVIRENVSSGVKKMLKKTGALNTCERDYSQHNHRTILICSICGSHI